MNERSPAFIRIFALLLALTVLILVALKLTSKPREILSIPSSTPEFISSPSSTLSNEEIFPQITITVKIPPEPEEQLAAQKEWSSTLLTILQERQEIPNPLLAATNWYGQTSIVGILAVDEEDVIAIDNAIPAFNFEKLDIYLPDSHIPEELLLIGQIEQDADAIWLAIFNGNTPGRKKEWRLHGLAIQDAVKILVEEAALSHQNLIVGFSQEQNTASLILLNSVDSASLYQHTPTPTSTPILLPTATATRIPSPELQAIIETWLKPIIDISGNFHPSAIAKYIQTHAWTGPLTWSLEGAEIGGREVNVMDADELDFYYLRPDDPNGTTIHFLTILHEGGTITLPEPGAHFFSHRTEEALYWMVVYASSRGGQLVAAYDCSGTKQTLTIIDFEPYDEQE